MEQPVLRYGLHCFICLFYSADDDGQTTGRIVAITADFKGSND